MKKLIIPTGYMGSGSSAITSYVSEFDDIHADFGAHEYVFMHTPGGVFDLEDKLLKGNNALRSDEALHTFSKVMNLLYDKKYWWVGNYKTTFGVDFKKITSEYLDSLILTKTDQYWYYQENTSVRMGIKLFFNRVLRLVSFNKIKGSKPLLYKEMWLSLPNQEEFYLKSKSYLHELFKLIGLDQRNIVLDQLLLPFNLHRLHKYFDENTYVIVVSRDPRDTFLINKYVYNNNNEGIPYPTDVHDFCKYYRAMRESEIPANSGQILRISFEDLVYDYDDTTFAIRKFLKLDSTKHSRKLEFFDPLKSIENTQLFYNNKDYNYESNVIEEELSEYLYNFPYSRKIDISKTF